jgi:DNA-binding response OmpR family regulator
MRQSTDNLPRPSHAPILPSPMRAWPAASGQNSLERTEASILLIDDDPAVCESLRRVLATEGWHVVTAKGGEEALEYLREHEPDLMITDLCMAPVNGWDLLFHENIQRPLLPIFVITALSLQATNGAAHFAAEFFQKPIDLDILLAAVRFHLANPSPGLPPVSPPRLTANWRP